MKNKKKIIYPDQLGNSIAVYICAKCDENISKGFQVTKRTHIYLNNSFQCSNDHNSERYHDFS